MRWHAVAIGLAAAVLYWLTGPLGTGFDVYVPLADAILDGHLWIGPHSWMELVPTADPQRWLVPFPPAPVLTLLLIGGAYRVAPSVSLRLAILASIAAYAVGMLIIWVGTR